MFSILRNILTAYATQQRSAVVPFVQRANITFRPKRQKYRKAFKGPLPRRVAAKGLHLAFGQFGLKAMEPGKLDPNQLEAARRAITRRTKREGRLFIRVFPDIPVSRKPAEVRMGKGKGAVDTYITKVGAGKIIFELASVSRLDALAALQLAQAKLPIKTKFVENIDYQAPGQKAAEQTPVIPEPATQAQ